MAKLANICIELIEERLVELEQPNALDNEEVVHQLRVLTKRLRAAWHLAQPVCGKDFAGQRREALRGLSAQLAQSRDQSVQSALAEKFYAEHPELPRDSLDALLNSTSAGTAEPSKVSTAEIQSALQAEIAAWKSVRLGGEERSTLRHRWRKSLKKARELTRQTAESTDPELWHSWRKAIKRLRYQREFLAMINPRILGKKDTRLRNLGTRLGDHNDLAVFTRLLESAELDPADKAKLKKAIAMQDQDIKNNCRRLGRRLFDSN